jgi:regulator of sirC expression with transglutaminase-like and TPR domain
MTIHIRAAAVAALILFVSVPFTFAQGRGGGQRGGGGPAPDKTAAWRGNAKVEGKVVDEAGKPLENVKVAFVFVTANSGFFATTKKNGEFSAKDIKAGEWRIVAESPNFITLRQPITIADSKSAPIALTLKRDNSPELLTKAEALFKAGQNAEARTEYLTVFAAHPELTAINRAIAFTYGREGKHPEALKYLDLALASNPDDSTLLLLAAASATQISDYPRATGYLAKIDVAALTEPAMLSDAAVNLINKQKAAEGIQVLDRVIARFPEDPDAYFYRGFARLQVSKGTDGKEDLEKYVAMAPSGPMAPKAKELLASVK